MVAKTVPEEFRLSETFWQRVEPLLPKFTPSPKGGRPRIPWRAVMDGIFYVLRTGCQWKAVPTEFGSGSTLHRYLQLLVNADVFVQIWQMALEEYDELWGLEWKWQAMDGAMTKAPLGGEKNGAQSYRSGQVRHQAELAHRGARDSHRRGRRQCQSA